VFGGLLSRVANLEFFCLVEARPLAFPLHVSHAHPSADVTCLSCVVRVRALLLQAVAVASLCAVALGAPSHPLVDLSARVAESQDAIINHVNSLNVVR
jgi:hypothetical protein